LEFGIWNLGFGIWDLGFRISPESSGLEFNSFPFEIEFVIDIDIE